MPPEAGLRQVIHSFPVEDREDPHLVPHDLVDDSVVPHAQFPIPVERAAEGFAVAVGGCAEPSFDGAGQAALQVAGNGRNIFARHRRMVEERGGHPASGSPAAFSSAPRPPHG